MFLFTPDGNQQRRLSLLDAAKDGGRALLHTVVKLRHYRNALLYLLAFMLYNDGLAAIIAFGGVYAAAIFGWGTVTHRHLRHHPHDLRHPRRLPGRSGSTTASAASGRCSLPCWA